MRGEPGKTDLATVNELCRDMNAWVHETCHLWLDRGKLVGLVGGDHSTSFGLIQAVSERHRGLGILHLDAHADLRRAYEGFDWSHASIMYNVMERCPGVAKLVQVGIRDFSGGEQEYMAGQPDRIATFFDPDLKTRMEDGEAWSALADEIVAALPELVHLSFDIDGLDPALCPHTGTPVPGGLSFPEAVSLLRKVHQSGRTVVGFDLTEVAPDPRGESDWDGNVGMRLLYKMTGYALLTASR